MPVSGRNGVHFRFPIGLHSVRTSSCKAIDRHLLGVRGLAGQPADDVVGKLAEVIARRWAKENAAPADARSAYADIAVEFLEIFYGVDSELATEGFSELWQAIAPHLGRTTSGPRVFTELSLDEDDFATWAGYVKELASFPAQREMLVTASDHELMRARRVVLFAFGNLRRITRAGGGQDNFEELGRRLLIALGRPTVPILIAALRNDNLRQKIMSLLLDFARMRKHGTGNANEARHRRNRDRPASPA